MSEWLRDLWRGYSDIDVTNVHRRMGERTNPGEIWKLSEREYRALIGNPMPQQTWDTPVNANMKLLGDVIDQSIINEIFEIRVRNNIPWKRLITIAMKHAPEETKAALRDINANDRAISDLMAELAK